VPTSRKFIADIDLIAASVVLRTRPDIVLLMIGTNDVINSPPGNMSQLQAPLLKLIGTIRAHVPKALIVMAKIATLPWHLLGQVNYNIRLQEVFDSLRAQDSRLRLVDMADGFTASMLSDGVHPTDEGYAHLASKWFIAIQGEL
jgi:lysophospholipase L1-like esterase